MTHVIAKKFQAGIVTLTESIDGNITDKNLLGLGEVLPVDQMLPDTSYTVTLDLSAVITYELIDDYGEMFGGSVLKNTTLPLSRKISPFQLCNGFKCVSSDVTDNEIGDNVLRLTTADLCGLWNDSQHTDETGLYQSLADTIVKFLTMEIYDWLTLQYLGLFKIFIHSEPLA
jgi:hypothetical protein